MRKTGVQCWGSNETANAHTPSHQHSRQMSEHVINQQPEKSMTFEFEVECLSFGCHRNMLIFGMCVFIFIFAMLIETNTQRVKTDEIANRRALLHHIHTDCIASSCVKSFQSSVDRIMFSGFVSPNYGN